LRRSSPNEVRERGTGLVTRKFEVYQASGTSITTIWEGVSFHHLFHALDEETPHFSSASGYLRCDPSGGDRPRPRLIYVHETDDGRGQTDRGEVALELEAGKLVERTDPAESPSKPSHQER
jgi:hypothetical protein